MFFTKFSIKLFCENYCAGRPLYITYYFSIRYTPPQKQNKQNNKQKNTCEVKASHGENGGHQLPPQGGGEIWKGRRGVQFQPEP